MTVRYVVHLTARVEGDDVDWREVADACVRELAGATLDVRGAELVVDDVDVDEPSEEVERDG